MQVTFLCPRCEQTARVRLGGEADALTCPHCEAAIRIPSGALTGEGLQRCLVCSSADLFVRKDFPQRLGVALVALGFVGSSIAWYYYQLYLTFGILFATVIVDVVLYLLVGQALVCYRCGALYRDVSDHRGHEPFSLETHERYRQQSARVATGQRSVPSD